MICMDFATVLLQIKTWSDNFESSLPKGTRDPFYPLFTKVSRLSPPDGDYSMFDPHPSRLLIHLYTLYSRTVCSPLTPGIIHGDMTISNVIFDDEVHIMY